MAREIADISWLAVNLFCIRMTDGHKKKLGRILLKRKLVNAKDLSRLISEQNGDGEPLASSMLEKGLADERRLLDALSEQYNVPATNLTDLEISNTCLSLLTFDIAEKYLVLPISETATSITLAMADPSAVKVIEEIEGITGKRVFPHVALHAQIARAIQVCYNENRMGGEDGHRQASDGIAPQASPPPDPPDKIEIEIVESASYVPRLSSVGPLASLPLELDGEDSPKKVGSNKRVILVVDDEFDILRLISRVLSSRGHKVITASRGYEAIEKLQTETLDLVILDAMLPEVHGFDICKQIKTNPKYQHLPVIMISAIYRGWRYAKDLKESYGVDDFIEKPFNIDELMKVVDRHCDVEPNDTRSAAVPASTQADQVLAACIEVYRNGDLDKAISLLKEAVMAHPLEFDLQYNLALLLGKKGLFHQAILELEKALDLVPDSFTALKNLAVLYQKTAFKLKAIETWERTLDHCPDDETRDGIKRHLVSLL